MSSLAQISPVFSDLAQAVRDYAQAAFAGIESAAPAEWFVPPGEEVDLRDPETIAAAFSRKDLHDQMLKIIGQLEDQPADAQKPENVSPSTLTGAALDLSVIQSQLEFIQAAERGYFNATMPYCRAAAHAAARHEAHAVDGGVIDRGIADYVASLKLVASGRSAS